MATTLQEREMIAQWKRELMESRHLRPVCSPEIMRHASCKLRQMMQRRRLATLERVAGRAVGR